jgi:hypothetical protein
MEMSMSIDLVGIGQSSAEKQLGSGTKRPVLPARIIDCALRVLGADRYLDDNISSLDLFVHGIATNRLSGSAWGTPDGKQGIRG